MNPNLDEILSHPAGESTSQTQWHSQTVYEQPVKLSQNLIFEDEAEEGEVIERSEQSNLSNQSQSNQVNLKNPVSNVYWEKGIKKQLRDEFDNNPLIQQQYGDLKKFVVQNLVVLATSGNKDDEVRMRALAEIAKIAGFKDNPKVTIIQNAIPELSDKDILYK